MSWYKIKINLTAKLYSEYRRRLSGGICAFKKTPKCKLIMKSGGIWDWKEQMNLCHFHSRAKFSVTYNDKNSDVGCIMCHKYLHEHKTEHEAWKLAQLGPGDFDKLLIASQILVRKSDQRIKETALRSWLRGEIKKLEQ